MIPTNLLQWSKDGVLQQWWVQPSLLRYSPAEVDAIAWGGGEWRDIPKEK